MSDTLYCIVDSRTGKRVSVAAFLTRGGAESQILDWRRRDVLGMRADCHEMMPFLAVMELRPNPEYDTATHEVEIH